MGSKQAGHSIYMNKQTNKQTDNHVTQTCKDAHEQPSDQRIHQIINYLKKLSYRKCLIEMKEEVAEKSNVDQCHQKLFLMPAKKGKNSVANHFGCTFNTGARKTKRMEGESSWSIYANI